MKDIVVISVGLPVRAKISTPSSAKKGATLPSHDQG